jgi:hypothetical protein
MTTTRRQFFLWFKISLGHYLAQYSELKIWFQCNTEWLTDWVSKLYITLIFIQTPTLDIIVHTYNESPGCFVTHALYNLSYEVQLSTAITAMVSAPGLTMEMPTETCYCSIMTARKSDWRKVC